MSKLFTKITVQDAEEKKEKSSSVWSTAKLDAYFESYKNGEILGSAPFIDGDIGKKSANLPFQYTPEELEEFKKCALDVVYFANRYASAMTDEGIQKITLRDYQETMLAEFQNNRYVALLASRQIGKCHYPLAELQVSIKGKEGYVLFYQVWRLFSKLKIHEKIQCFLLDMITYLSKSKEELDTYKKTISWMMKLKA